MFDEKEIENVAKSIMKLNQQSLQKLLDYNFDGELLYVFWEMTKGETVKNIFEKKKDSNKRNIKEERSRLNADITKTFTPIISLGESEELTSQFGSYKRSLEERENSEFLHIGELQLLEIMMRITLEVKALHDKGFVHGSINTSGIFIVEGGKIIFGDISLKSNLELAKYHELTLSHPHTTNPINIPLFHKDKLYAQDSRALQFLLIQLANFNLTSINNYSPYTLNLNNFLTSCQTNSFRDINQIISMNLCMYLYIYILNNIYWKY